MHPLETKSIVSAGDVLKNTGADDRNAADCEVCSGGEENPLVAFAGSAAEWLRFELEGVELTWARC